MGTRSGKVCVRRPPGLRRDRPRRRRGGRPAARGFGEDPIAAYTAPPCPTRTTTAFYRWLDAVWGADAVVHLGKHGTLEWLPGKGAGLSAACAPDAAIGDLPLLYPFVVNDPGEGTQAKRRGTPGRRSPAAAHDPRETYDDLARVERLLDEYAKIEALDPAKLPAIRGQLWDLLVTSELVRDLGVETMPDPDDFAGMVGHIDGYLCALKDAQIRGGLHVLGRPPTGPDLVDTVLAICRQPQAPCPRCGPRSPPSSGWTCVERDPGDRPAGGRVPVPHRCAGRPRLGSVGRDGDPTLRWVATTLVPNLRRTSDEIANLLAGLAGGHVPAGPPGHRRGAPPTSCRPVGTSTRSIPRPCPPRWRGTSGGRCRPARGAPSGRDRRVSPHRGAGRVGDCQHAHRATTSPRSLPCWACARSGTTIRPRPGPGAGAAGRARPTTGRRDRTDLGVLPRRLPRRGRPAGRRRHLVGGLDEPADDNPVRAAGLADARVFDRDPAPTARASTRRSRAGRGAPGLTSRRSTWPGPATRTGAGGRRGR